MQTLLNGAEFYHDGIDPGQALALTLAGQDVLNRALSTEEFCNWPDLRRERAAAERQVQGQWP